MHVAAGEARAGRKVTENAPKPPHAQAFPPRQTQTSAFEIVIFFSPLPPELSHLFDGVPDHLLYTSNRLLLPRFAHGVFKLRIDIIVLLEANHAGDS
jgi:hypothetical protein